MSNNTRHVSQVSAPAGLTTIKPRNGSATHPASHDWMAPVDAKAPCGVDPEYDPEFVVLLAKAVPRPEAQYGDFVGAPELANWNDIDRDCRRLMMRSKDMRLAVLFARCRTRLAGAAGLAEGVGLLAAWLRAFPEALHPQPDADSDRDAALEIRMNALQAMTDADGLLLDVREIALTKSTAAHLQMRDVERAFAHPRPSDALAPESVTRQIQDLRNQQPEMLAGFDDALTSFAAIEKWSREHLGVYSPDLSALTRLLCHVGDQDERAADPDPEFQATNAKCAGLAESALDISLPARQEDDAKSTLAASPVRRARTTSADRHGALELIREARQWFEQHEPSSPIPVLLRRAEQFVGKRYADVVQAIPTELLVQWENEA